MSFTQTAGDRLVPLINPLATATVDATPPLGTAEIALLPRNEVADASAEAALQDSEFLELAAVGDRHRDAHEWRQAELAYARALALYPYQAGYWIQHGHVRKEQGRFAEAEISYRTGAALGVASDAVLEHLRFVMDRQGVSEARYPARFRQQGSAAEQTPGEPDVQLLARLLWRAEALPSEDLLTLLRQNSTCDDLFAAMVADRRFEHANLDWITQMHDGDI